MDAQSWRECLDAWDFFASPTRAILRRGNFTFVGACESLIAFICRGHLTAEDLANLRALAELPCRVERPYDVIVEATQLLGFDAHELPALLEIYRAHLPAVRRQAVVMPSGMIGMALAGFLHVANTAHPIAPLASLDEAIAWLDYDPEALAEFRDRCRAPEYGGGHEAQEILSRSRALLRARTPSLSIDDAARELGVSVRTLQRRLSEASTTFEKERTLACVVRAKALLASTNFGIKHIALELGLSSPVRLAQLFQRHEGLSPLKWREAHRLELGRWR